MDKSHIWRVMLLAISFNILFLAEILGKPTTFSVENPGWNEKAFERLQETFDDKMNYLEQQLNSKNKQGYLLGKDGERVFDKRGFAMLARWRPFSRIGKQRTSIRDISRAPYIPYDVVSAETRAFARPSGEPLRWG